LPAASLADGRVLSYVDAGLGPVVVMESGLGNPGATWVAVQKELAWSCRTITYDRAGLGSSEAASGLRTLDCLAADLVELLDAVGSMGPILLVAHSWGGPVAHVAAVRRPDLIRGLVLVDPTFAAVRRHLRTARPTYAWWYLQARVGLRDRLLRYYQRDDRWTGLTPPQRATALADLMTVPNLHTSLRELRGLRRSFGRLAELDGQAPAAPCRILLGARRPGPLLESMVGEAERLCARHSDSSVVLIEGAGHSIPQESPHRIAKEVLDFLAVLNGSKRYDRH
jgi:pimeloyl-ACP methyl ester carboxylesterase